jgi:nitroreductase
MKPEKSAVRKQQETAMSVMEAIYKRQATRSFVSRKPARKVIEALLDAAVRAPTALHEEPWAFAVIQDKELLRRISDNAKQTLGDIAGRGHAFERFLDPQSSVFYNAGTLVVIYAKHMGPYVTADCWLAAENLILAACAMGLGTCVIGLATTALNEPELKKELGIPAEMMAVAPIIIGMPKGEMPHISRKSPEIIFWR